MARTMANQALSLAKRDAALSLAKRLEADKLLARLAATALGKPGWERKVANIMRK